MMYRWRLCFWVTWWLIELVWKSTRTRRGNSTSGKGVDSARAQSVLRDGIIFIEHSVGFELRLPLTILHPHDWFISLCWARVNLPDVGFTANSIKEFDEPWPIYVQAETAHEKVKLVCTILCCCIWYGGMEYNGAEWVLSDKMRVYIEKINNVWDHSDGTRECNTEK